MFVVVLTLAAIFSFVLVNDSVLNEHCRRLLVCLRKLMIVTFVFQYLYRTNSDFHKSLPVNCLRGYVIYE